MSTKDIRTNFLLGQLTKLFKSTSYSSLTNIGEVGLKKILIVAPHADDEVIGCGAALQHFVSQGAHVCVLIVTQESERSIAKAYHYEPQQRVQESYDAQEVLGYDQLAYFDFPELMLKSSETLQHDFYEKLMSFIADYAPDGIFLPNSKEMHPDHQIIGELSKTVVSDIVKNGLAAELEAVFIYEIWGTVAVNSYLQVTDTAYKSKIKSIECYQSQMVSVDYTKIIDFIGDKRGALLQETIDLDCSKNY
jgi:N-acetylglucosamine malate deacetylase 1